ncbi:MAG: arginine--tRNA ligase [Leptospiraceae bacterium]|nr:arginine--tRNA ligase [Leptospiraceae bacterium]MCP5495252.1 arginine--tRNA ligase [Leptospiraceae bacterium]
MKETDLLKNKVLNELQITINQVTKSEDFLITENELKIKIEYSRNEKFGDYSSSFLMENKNSLKGDISEIGDKIITSLEKNPLFENISYTKPGFLNFQVSQNTLLNYIQESIFSDNQNDLYAHLENPQKIIFEFVSANPTGPLNIVSARAAATGDTICNLLEKAGNIVHREFYVNDFGNQVNLLGISCLARIREYLGENIQLQDENQTLDSKEIFEGNFIPYEGYRGDYLKDFAKQVYINPEYKEYIDTNLKNKNYTDLAFQLSDWTVETIVQEQKKDLEAFGVKFNEFFREKTLHNNDSVMKALENLKTSNDIAYMDGKTVFLSTKYGDDKDRVVVRDDGRPTYLLADIAYHKTKMDRGFTHIINIWGPDHYGYIQRLKGAMMSLGYPEHSFQITIAQQVNLLSKGEKVKMSKRLGQLQTMKDLLDYLGEHARDVGRYFFIMRSLETPLDFDLDLAKDESDKNPVFYLQYAHARICSIFREVGEDYSFEALQNIEMTEERKRLLFFIARFSEEVLDAAKSMEPHRLINYLQNLAKAFTKFYMAKNNRLKDCDGTTRKALAYICKATAICLREGLSLLGINALERLERVNS